MTTAKALEDIAAQCDAGGKLVAAGTGPKTMAAAWEAVAALARKAAADPETAPDDAVEREAAALWRSENPDKSVFGCDHAEQETYRARVRLQRTTAPEAIKKHEGWRYGELIYRAMYEHDGGKWNAVSDRDKDRVWYAAGYRLQKLLPAAWHNPALIDRARKRARDLRMDYALAHDDRQLVYDLIAAAGAVTLAAEAWPLIEALRGPEGHTVTLVCDNPDFGPGPNAKVIVCGDWTGWDDREYPGDTVLDALKAAHIAMLAAAEPPTPVTDHAAADFTQRRCDRLNGGGEE